jgi:tetratricopeptide (TPR) repeat protein
VLNLETAMRKSTLILLIIVACGIVNNTAGQVRAGNDSISMIRKRQERINQLSLVLKSGTPQPTSRAVLYIVLGNDERDLKQYNKAILDYTHALALNPDLGLAYLNRGDVYRRQKDYEKAKNDFNRAIARLNDDKLNQSIAYYNMSMMSRYEKNYDKAIQQDSIAIALNPGYAAAYSARADLYAMKGKFQLGINDLTVAMYGFQDKPLVLSFMLSDRADMKRALKQNKDAINDYSQALKLNGDNRNAYWNQAAAYRTNGDYQLAYDGYNKAMTYFKHEPKRMARLYDERALAEVGMQQYKQAIADDSLAITLDTAYDAAYYNEANARAQNGEYNLSNTGFKKAMYYYRNNQLALTSIYSSMAHNEYFLSNYQTAIDYCTKAIALNTVDWSPYFERGRAYLKMNNKDLAVNDFKEILARDTSKQSADYAFSLYYTGSPDKAVEVMQSSFLKTTDSFVLMGDYYNMACLYAIMNKPEEANNFLKKCIDGGYNKKYALTDGDFDNIRNTAEFKNIMGIK